MPDIGRETAPLSHGETRGKGASLTSRNGRDVPAGTWMPGGWEGGWRGQGTRSGGSHSPSVIAQGWELAALRCQAAETPPSPRAPFPSQPQGGGTAEHPGFKTPPNPIPDLISHLNPSPRHIKPKLRPQCRSVFSLQPPAGEDRGRDRHLLYLCSLVSHALLKAVTDKIAEDSRQ